VSDRASPSRLTAIRLERNLVRAARLMLARFSPGEKDGEMAQRLRVAHDAGGLQLACAAIGKVVGDRGVQLRGTLQLGDFDAPALKLRQPCLRLRPTARLHGPPLAFALVIEAIHPYRALAFDMADAMGSEAQPSSCRRYKLNTSRVYRDVGTFYGTFAVMARI
jgi:hypothetical protein